MTDMTTNNQTTNQTTTQGHAPTASLPAKQQSVTPPDPSTTWLSPHFRLIEFTRSGVATDKGIDNTPGPSEVEALRALCENILEPMRRRFGAIYISSGYRCRRVNNAVGGVMNSQHMRGEAADILLSTFSDWRDAVRFVKELDFDQMLVEPLHDTRARWLHVSYTTRHRNRHILNLGDRHMAVYKL